MHARRTRVAQAFALVALLCLVILASAPRRAAALCGHRSETTTYWLDAICTGVPPHRICQDVEPSIVGQCTIDCDDVETCWGDNDPNLRQTFSSAACPHCEE
jgi:hypothetical protein